MLRRLPLKARAASSPQPQQTEPPGPKLACPVSPKLNWFSHWDLFLCLDAGGPDAWRRHLNFSGISLHDGFSGWRACSLLDSHWLPSGFNWLPVWGHFSVSRSHPAELLHLFPSPFKTNSDILSGFRSVLREPHTLWPPLSDPKPRPVPNITKNPT